MLLRKVFLVSRVLLSLGVLFLAGCSEENAAKIAPYLSMKTLNEKKADLYAITAFRKVSRCESQETEPMKFMDCLEKAVELVNNAEELYIRDCQYGNRSACRKQQELYEKWDSQEIKWPVSYRDDCTDEIAKQLEAMGGRCELAYELPPAAFTAWKEAWCGNSGKHLKLSGEQRESLINACNTFFERQYQNIQAAKEGKPIPYPPPSEAEMSQRMYESCKKYVESQHQQGKSVDALGSCEGILTD